VTPCSCEAPHHRDKPSTRQRELLHFISVARGTDAGACERWRLQRWPHVPATLKVAPCLCEAWHHCYRPSTMQRKPLHFINVACGTVSGECGRPRVHDDDSCVFLLRCLVAHRPAFDHAARYYGRQRGTWQSCRCMRTATTTATAASTQRRRHLSPARLGTSICGIRQHNTSCCGSSLSREVQSD
jgi:hypothetical protein